MKIRESEKDGFDIDPIIGQAEIDKWFYNLPLEIDATFKELNQLLSQFNSFQLIANISHLNHLRDTKKAYTDYNEGRMAIIPEFIATLMIGREFQNDSLIPIDNLLETVEKVNELAIRYLGKVDMHKRHQAGPPELPETTVEQVAKKLNRDETWVSNPGFPDHHFEIAEELLAPLDSEIAAQFGFSIEQSILIRKNEVKFLNKRFAEKIAEADRKAAIVKDQVLKYRHTGKISSDSLVPIDQIKQLQPYNSKKLKVILAYHFRKEVYYNLNDMYSFSGAELASFCDLPKHATEQFLNTFSCSFGLNVPESEFVGPNALLRSHPIIKHDNRYLIPSFALLTWCVEPAIEDFIKKSTKLSNRYKDLKHDFLLRKGIQLLKIMLPTAVFYPENLYYKDQTGEVCETDGIIAYNDTIFVIEAKGHRITNKSKGGNFKRTETHLENLIRDASRQGKRTFDYVKSNDVATFTTKKGQTFNLDSSLYKNFIVISLTLEPIGNITPLIKVSNDLNFFTESEFPWIVSIYDLIVFADHIEMPILLLHYLKRRKRFLEVPNMHIYEEIDLLGYYLSGGLYIENTLKNAADGNFDWLSFEGHTDEFNDFYMSKYGHKSTVVPKVTSFLSDDIKDLLKLIESSAVPEKNAIMLEILEFSTSSVKKFTEQIAIVRRQFKIDNEIHDCSIGSTDNGTTIGLTYMIGPDRDSVNQLLYKYCNFKFDQQSADIWVGVGEVSQSGECAIQGSFLKSRTLR